MRTPLTISALVVVVSTFVIHVVLDTVYRPWAWSVRCADAHLADSFTNITSDMGLSALMVLFEGRRWWSSQISSWLTVLVPVLSMVIYELVQTVLPWGRFDLWDVAWTVAGGGIALIVKRLVFDPHARQQ